MNKAVIKKHARDLQAITGMPYQSAQRAVTEGTACRASVHSGLTLSDFVTPREVRIWLQINSGHLDCAAGRHWMLTEDLGECVSCGLTTATFFDDEGNEYNARIDEDEFLERCEKVGMYYEWAPPLEKLDGMTQREYVQMHSPRGAYDW